MGAVMVLLLMMVDDKLMMRIGDDGGVFFCFLFDFGLDQDAFLLLLCLFFKPTPEGIFTWSVKKRPNLVMLDLV